MENIILQAMAGNAPTVLIMAYALFRLDKRLSKIEFKIFGAD